MSDQSQGPGWWVASDGKWYPPEAAPPTLPPPPPSPGPGWWQAADGKWYPPAAPSGPSPYAAPPTVPSPPMNGCLKAFLIGVAVLVGLAILGAILAPGDDDSEQSGEPTAPKPSVEDPAPENTTTSSSDSTPPPAAAPESVTLSAEGEQNTDPFTLKGGDYTVQYDLGGDCYYSAELEPVDEDPLFFESLASGTGPVAADTNLYDIDPGSYYVQMITGPSPSCPWTIVLTAR